jgi:hypothetical protein
MSVITFREFTSPHVYAYGDCCVYKGVAYQCITIAGTDGVTGFKEIDWKVIPFSTDLTISAALTAIINNLQTEIIYNRIEIECLNKNISQLVFELLNQGIKIENQELLNKLNYIK